MRSKIVAGNWKMNGSSAFVQDYLTAFAEQSSDMVPENVQVIIAPPTAYLVGFAAADKADGIELAAQNVASQEAGAYTGETSASMLKDAGCAWSLVGHSERRSLYGETDNDVVAKISQLLNSGLKPILCVGETLEEREAGRAQDVVFAQVGAVLEAFSDEELQDLVIAYEPVWAIGTGKTASPEQAQEMHAAIRGFVAKQSAKLADDMAILYGGSVNVNTAAELFSQNDIDGGLVGGASLKVGDFLQICKSAE